jgi:hypothetical protein
MLVGAVGKTFLIQLVLYAIIYFVSSCFILVTWIEYILNINFLFQSNVCRHWAVCEQNHQRDPTGNKCTNCSAAFPGNPVGYRFLSPNLNPIDYNHSSTIPTIIEKLVMFYVFHDQCILCPIYKTCEDTYVFFRPI